MKLAVITDKSGKIVGTAHHGTTGKPGSGSGGPIAGPDQTVHVVDVPDDLGRIEDAAELHRRLHDHLRS